jgi:Rad9
MDCVIPGHSFRAFTGAIQCLSKIGKDLYVDFDPMDGLALRTLNDAKSAFCVVEFGPSFFERCTTPVLAQQVQATTATNSGTTRKRGRQTSTSTCSSQESRFSCRVPMKALAPIVRPRKNIVTVRIKSEGHEGDTAPTNDNASLLLAFEFQLDIQNQSDTTSTSTNGSSAGTKPTLCKVIHRMGVAQVDNISAVAPKDDCSELAAAPRLLHKWLEPINRTAEGCLIFTKDADLVVATSFNSTDSVGISSLSIASGAAKRTLKTETCIQLKDLDEFDFRDNRTIRTPQQLHRNNQDTGMPHPCPMPDNVNDEVVLVFGIKEAKAFLHYCTQQASNSSRNNNAGYWNDDSMHDGRHNRAPWSVSLSFHWAGRPLIWEAKSGGSLSMQLVLATLGHSILKDMPIMKQRAQSQQMQQQRGGGPESVDRNRRHST